MKRDQLNRLRRMAGVHQDFKAVENKIVEDVVPGMGQILRGGQHKFYLVTAASKDSELGDVITEVDTRALINIVIGASQGPEQRFKEWEMFPHDKQKQALDLARTRLAKAGVTETIGYGASSSNPDNTPLPDLDDTEDFDDDEDDMQGGEDKLSARSDRDMSDSEPFGDETSDETSDEEYDDSEEFDDDGEFDDEGEMHGGEDQLSARGDRDMSDSEPFGDEYDDGEYDDPDREFEDDEDEDYEGNNYEDEDFDSEEEDGKEFTKFSKLGENRAVQKTVSFSKGQKVKYKGQTYVVEVPNAKANFIGIVPPGHEGDKDKINLVRIDRLKVTESGHYHTNDNYPATHVNHKDQPVNVDASYDTVWDKDDPIDNDYKLANDTTKVKVPAKILSELKRVIDEVTKEAEKAKRNNRDWETSHYYEDTAQAFQIVYDYLNEKTVQGLKRAQYYSQRMMNIQRVLMPDTVWKFIVDGGEKRSLKSYMNDVKDPTTGEPFGTVPTDTLNKNTHTQ